MSDQACGHCPREEAEREASQGIAGVLACDVCDRHFYMPGSAARVRGWNPSTCTLTRKKVQVVETPDEEHYRAYRKARGFSR